MLSRTGKSSVLKFREIGKGEKYIFGKEKKFSYTDKLKKELVNIIFVT